MVFRGYRASDKPRCSCGAFLSETRATGLNRIQCGSCKKWTTEYVNPNRETAD